MATIDILIKPSFTSTRDNMGFSEGEDYDSDKVLFQQGWDMDFMEVESGEDFEIDDDFEGQINCEETKYKLIQLNDRWENELDEWEDDIEEVYVIVLKPGRYKFLEDGITITELK